MRNTDDNQRPNDSAPHKIPGALRPPVPWDGNPAPVAPAEDAEAAGQREPRKTAPSGFSSFES
ncbi:hypothetical protein [Methylobacterium sp. J-076]|uniref:hypothetical protein n=1 Tax=Methylobacterium sp. J-076 TaxID=2836655 RepID=UPI001FBA3EFE|nr:hypothetical protein [Methylobacterium sp. J-076]MCJ2013060.1 hypothetical protein [Methylobacterium sp. J-076]